MKKNTNDIKEMFDEIEKAKQENLMVINELKSGIIWINIQIILMCIFFAITTY